MHAPADAAAPPVTTSDTRLRLRSLDVFRGLTIFAMMLVNKQGNDAGYAPLQHVPWHGATPTDWIFPFFLFIVGVALPFSIEARLHRGETHAAILRHACTRAAILFALGVFEKNFPFLSTTLETFRIPGVLQRIAMCYLAATALFLYTSRAVQATVALVILVGYWTQLAFVPVPGVGVVPMTREFASQNWTAWLDQLTMGRHLGYGNRTWDANGLLSSVPAIVSVQAGMLASYVIARWQASMATVRRLAGWGVLAVVAGWLWGGLPPLIGPGIVGEPSVAAGWVFPINKMLWTSSYVLFTNGLALLTLASCVWALDLGTRAGGAAPLAARPFIWFGTNAIFAYLASGLAAKLLHVLRVTATDGTRVSWWDAAHAHVFAPLIPSAPLASLVHSLSYALLWVVICAWMYRRRLFVKL